MAGNISRFVFRNTDRLFARFSQHELRIISNFFSHLCWDNVLQVQTGSNRAFYCTMYIDSSVGTVLASHPEDSRFESCRVQDY